MEDVYSFLEAVGPHIAQHLKALSVDPTRKGALKALMKQWHDLSGITDKLGQKLREGAQKRQQAQRVASGMDPDTQLKAAETQAKMRNADMKTRHQMGLREQQAGQKMALNAAQTQQKMALADASTAADIQRKRFSAFDPQSP